MRISKRKAEIIEKATDLFYKHGFVKASIRDIVKAVGVTNSAVYNHFANKDEILYRNAQRADKDTPAKRAEDLWESI